MLLTGVQGVLGHLHEPHSLVDIFFFHDLRQTEASLQATAPSICKLNKIINTTPDIVRCFSATSTGNKWIHSKYVYGSLRNRFQAFYKQILYEWTPSHYNTWEGGVMWPKFTTQNRSGMSSIGTSQNIVPQYPTGHNGQSGGADDELYAIYILVVSTPGCRVSTPCFYVQPLASVWCQWMSE